MEEKVLAWEATVGGVRVKTSRDEYEAGQLVISAGPWTGPLLADLGLGLRVERQVQFWFEPAGGVAAFAPEDFPSGSGRRRTARILMVCLRWTVARRV